MTIYVFDKGEPTDADTLPNVIINKNYPNEREIPCQKTGTGLYSSELTIQQTDIVHESYFYVSVQANIGNDEESTERSIDIYEEEDKLNVDIFIGDHYEAETYPGETLDITVYVEYEGVKITPDSFELRVNEHDDMPGGDPIPYSNPNVGVYEASYTVDSSITESTTLYINAEVEYNGVSDNRGADIIVNIFSVWYHCINITDTSAQFEICVSDLDGKAVSGADVNFDFRTDKDETGSKSGTTDVQGKSLFTIGFSNTRYLNI
jgi:hypothetical protein